MKNKIILTLAAAAALVLSACALSQVEASAVFIGAEAATAGILQKHPESLPALKLLVDDWAKFQGGTLTGADEATLLQSIVNATNKKLTPTQAAILDGAAQQIIANRNTSAPTPLSGAAASVISDLVNGVARELVVYSAAVAP